MKYNKSKVSKEARAPFTQREEQIINLITLGLSSYDIADKLCLDINTVKSHRRNMIKKVSAQNIYGVIFYCLIHDIVDIRLLKQRYVQNNLPDDTGIPPVSFQGHNALYYSYCGKEALILV